MKINRANKSAVHITGYDTDTPVPEACTSVAANYIHSLDAWHMHLVAIAAANEGIAMVGVHVGRTSAVGKDRHARPVESTAQLFCMELKAMTTRTNDPLKQLLAEAARYSMLLKIYRADPKISESTKALMRTVFAMQREDDREIER